MTADRWKSRVAIDPAIHHGEPCVKGTRIPVAVVVASVAELSIEEVLKHYPQLTREDVQACLFFAADASRSSMVA